MNEIRLVSPGGNRVRVAEERAAELRRLGYREADRTSVPVDLTPKPRSRRSRKEADE